MSIANKRKRVGHGAEHTPGVAGWLLVLLTARQAVVREGERFSVDQGRAHVVALAAPRYSANK